MNIKVVEMNWTKIKQSSTSLMIVIVISKIIGMLRDIVLANFYGTSNVSDAYLIASSVPILLFYFIGQSLSTAYIPMYNRVKVEKSEKDAVWFSNNILNCTLILSTGIIIILLLFPDLIVKLFATGFDTETAKIATRLIRISAPSIYLMSIVHICGGYLQANKSFLAPAAISLPRNLAVVVSVVLASSLGTDILGWGLLFSYIFEFLFLLPFIFRKGYKYSPALNLNDKYLKKTLFIVMPILLGMCVSQINKIIDRTIASTVAVGGISALSYASIINNAVQEILVTGIITVLFSNCAEWVEKKSYNKVLDKLSSTNLTLVFLLVPASVGVFVLAEPIIEFILNRGNFNENSIIMTTGALRCYTVGLLFLAIRDTLVKVFYAYKSTKITTVTSIVAILINIALNFLLSRVMGINGLALATSISAFFHCIALYIILRKKIGDFGLNILIKTFLKSLIASIIMAIGIGVLANILTSSSVSRFTLLVSCVFFGLVLYFIVSVIIHNKVIYDKFFEIKMFYIKKKSGDC